MRNYEYIKRLFLEKHESIDNCEYLDKYINFLINYKLDDNIDYTEKHHILPKCFFPEYKDDEWNIIELSYEDHKVVHLWIFKAINNRTYQRPLNWMMNYYKNKQETSNASKKGWMNLKSNKDKYNTFCMKRSNYMKNLSSDEQSRRSNIFWKNISDIEYLDFCNKIKDYWTEERKKEKSIQMLEYYSNLENIVKKSIESKNVWESRSDEERKLFSEKMTIINKDKTKRREAGNKIKSLWKNDEYLEKMKNRKPRKGLSIRVIYSNGDEDVFETMESLNKKLNFSSHLIRKYRDKDKKIIMKDLNNDNIILLDALIKTID
jgi:hypothetical protein